MNILKNFSVIFLTGVLALSLAGCQNSEEITDDTGRLLFTGSSQPFVLTSECVDYLYNSSSSEFPNNFSVFIKVKKAFSCSGKMNAFFKQNVGKKIFVTFNNEQVTWATIISPLIVEKGYEQSVANSILVQKILEAYRDKVYIFNDTQPEYAAPENGS